MFGHELINLYYINGECYNIIFLDVNFADNAEKTFLSSGI